MDKKYLFTLGLSDTIIVPPYFSDDVRCGVLPEGIDVLKGEDEEIDYSALTDEFKSYLCMGNVYLQNRAIWFRLLTGYMASNPDSVLYMVDGYPKAALYSACYDYSRMINQLRNENDEKYTPNPLEVVGTNKEDPSITDWNTKVEKTFRPSFHAPKVLYSFAHTYNEMKVKMETAELWGEKKGFDVKPLHTVLLHDLFPDAYDYIRKIEREAQIQKSRMGHMGMPGGITPMGNA